MDSKTRSAPVGSAITNINVGILGHVDSGKTSLVKALSTSLSTAALDKNPQSQQRGITLDLGFSSFMLPMPDHLISKPETELKSSEGINEEKKMQFTLVDCPGHASLIKTIIGGAQIIDMIVLVIDANKGIQTQTAECIVIGEITTSSLIVVLNKIDLIPIEEREAKLEKITARIQNALSTTKFKDAPIICTAAAVGGEKVAAVGSSNTNTPLSSVAVPHSSGESAERNIGIKELVKTLCLRANVPERDFNSPFYFAIDHCFPIKGHGTVLTGTVLSGQVAVNQIIELPYIQQQRKVKSMQMFHKNVKLAKQGDRLGMCVTNLDATTIERGIAVEPGSVLLLRSVLCLVKKIRFFKGICKSNTKYHVSIGHTTVIANAIFFGGKEIREKLESEKKDDGSKCTSDTSTDGIQSLSTTYQHGFPSISFDWSDEFQHQDALIAKDGEVDDGVSSAISYGNEAVQWAYLQFSTPVFCPIHSLVIGSRLDTDTREDLNSSKNCRLAFYGPIKHGLQQDGALHKSCDDINIYSMKEKDATIFKLTDVRAGGICYELIACDLYGEGGSIAPFSGLKLKTKRGQVGTIATSYGSGGKFKVKFAQGVPRSNVAVGTKLFLQFKRFFGDKTKSMKQSGSDVKEGEFFSNDGEPISNIEKNDATERSTASETINKLSLSDTIASKKNHKAKENTTIAKETEANIDSNRKSYTGRKATEIRKGTVDVLKEEITKDGSVLYVVAIISGAFHMEENIRDYVGSTAVGPDGETGEVLGPYAKMGKCKVRFPDGLKGHVGMEININISL